MVEGRASPKLGIYLQWGSECQEFRRRLPLLQNPTRRSGQRYHCLTCTIYQIKTALESLYSLQTEERILGLHYIYRRYSFTREDVQIAIDRLRENVRFQELGAIYYIIECSDDTVLNYLSKSVAEHILSLAPVTVWQSNIWTGSEIVLWLASKKLKLSVPKLSDFLVTEVECNDDLELCYYLLTGVHVFEDQVNLYGNSFLRRSDFSSEEIMLAKELLVWDGGDTWLGGYCAHVLCSVLSTQEILEWGGSEIGDAEFKTIWGRVSHDLRIRLVQMSGCE